MLLSPGTPQFSNGQRGALIDHFLSGAAVSAAAGAMLGLFAGGNGTAAGTAAISTPDASAIGVLAAQTGSTTTGRHGLQTTGTHIILGGGALAVSWRFQLPVLLDGTESGAIYLGFGDTLNGAPTDGAYLYWDNTQANFRYRTRSNTTQTDVDSGLAPVAATWYTAKVAVNAAGNNVNFTINGANGQNIATNIPLGVGRETGLIANIIKSAGTTARNLYLDYCLLEWDGFNA